MTLTLCAVLPAAFAAQPAAVTYRVANFTCPTCKFTIAKALGQVPGVEVVAIDPKSATVQVRFDPRRVPAGRVAGALADAGFPAQPLPRPRP
ncbi:MAG: heavy-metal-associated domain-containing protein [Pseudomonadota bacterium]